MAIPSYMLGLLGQNQSLAPNIGLLGAASGTPAIKAALAALAAQRPQVTGGAPAPAPQRPTLAAAPSSAPMAPRIPGQGPAPLPSIPAGPLMSPLVAGGLAGGAAALAKVPGSYYTGPGPAIAAALQAGIPAWAASKQQGIEKKASDQEDKAFQASLDGILKERPDMAAAVAAARGMSRRNAEPMIQKMLETGAPGIDPFSPEATAAKMELEITKITQQQLANMSLEERRAAAARDLERLKVQLEDASSRNPNGPQALALKERIANIEGMWHVRAAEVGAANRPPPKTPALDQWYPAKQAFDEIQTTLDTVGGKIPKLADLQAAVVALQPEAAHELKGMLSGGVATDAAKALVSAAIRAAEAENKARMGGRGTGANIQRAFQMIQSDGAIKAARKGFESQVMRENGGVLPDEDQNGPLGGGPAPAATPAIDLTQHPGETDAQWAARLAAKHGIKKPN